MARPAISMPSSTVWGSPSRMLRSMKAPGSPSSALQMRYFASPAAFLHSSHFRPVRKPAPPRPRSPDLFIVSMICPGVISKSALPSASYPPLAMYSSISRG